MTPRTQAAPRRPRPLGRRGRPVDRGERAAIDLSQQLYRRQAATQVASWEAYARHSRGAHVSRCDGAAVAVFPAEPERSVYNNALLERGMDPARAARALDAVEAAYRDASIDHYAVWAHEAERTSITELGSRGYRFDSSTRAMAMPLDRLVLPRPELALADLDWDGYVRGFGVPPGLLAGADATEFNLRAARLDGSPVGVALAFDHDGDCGIYNLETLEPARRRGIGTALTALQLHEARERGCTTASLQSTAVAEGVYASLGFLDLGRYLESVPAR
jgi:GNAT superfamily N-acetyltransferase